MHITERLSDIELGQALLQIGMMSRSGLDLGTAFEILSESSSPKKQADAYAVIAGRIRDGAYPDEAMLDSGLFPRQCCGLVAAGMESGKLDETFESLSGYYTRMGKLKSQLKSAMVQPFVMLGMSLAVFLLVVLKILPVFDGVYASLGGSLDGIAGALLKFGTWLRHAAPVIAWAMGVLLVAAMLATFVRPVRDIVTGTASKKFGDKGVFRAMNDARYMQAVSMGMDAGLVPEKASRMAASLQDEGTTARARYDRCSERLAGGGRMPDIGREEKILDAANAAILETGLRSGCEPDAARNVAALMLDDVEGRISRLSGLIEPAVTAFGSGLIGAVILAAMLPLLGVMNAIG